MSKQVIMYGVGKMGSMYLELLEQYKLKDCIYAFL